MSQSQEAPPRIESGRWQGEFLDANGFQGRLEMELDGDGDKFSGTFQLVVRQEDEPLRLRGRVEGEVRDEEVRLRWHPAEGRESVETRGHLRDAGSYARQAILGMSAPVPETNFGGAVWIAWRFADEGRR